MLVYLSILLGVLNSLAPSTLSIPFCQAIDGVSKSNDDCSSHTCVEAYSLPPPGPPPGEDHFALVCWMNATRTSNSPVGVSQYVPPKSG